MRRNKEVAAEHEAALRVAAEEAAASRVQATERARAHREALAVVEAEAQAAQTAAREKESAIHMALGDADKMLDDALAREAALKAKLELAGKVRQREILAATTEIEALQEAVLAAEAEAEDARQGQSSTLESMLRSEANVKQKEVSLQQQSAMMQVEVRRHGILLVRLATRAAKRMRLSCALKVWAASASIIDMEEVAYESGNKNMELHGRLAALKERQHHLDEARDKVEESTITDDKKQLALLRRKLATEMDRRVTQTAELKEATAAREAAVRREEGTKALVSALENTVRVERADATKALCVKEALLEEALLACNEANERGRAMEEAMDAAMRVRESLQAHGSFKLETSEATCSRLRLEVSRMARECDESSRAAAAREAAVQLANARADKLERSLEESQAAIALESAKAALALRDRDEARNAAQHLALECERERNQGAISAAELAAAVRRVAEQQKAAEGTEAADEAGAHLVDVAPLAPFDAHASARRDGV